MTISNKMLFVFILTTLYWTGCKTVQASALNKIALGGLFPIHFSSKESRNECSTVLSPWGFQSAHAMLYAIGKINKDDTVLPNITLVANLFDTCANKDVTTDHVKQLVRMKIIQGGGIPLIGVIGAAVSDVSATVANILQVFEIPQISYASTSVLLSDKYNYGYFLRTVAPDSFQAKVMVDLCLEFDWRYVMTASSTGIYGTSGIEEFTRQAQHHNICTDHIKTFRLLSTKAMYKQAIQRIVERRKNTAISTVVMFCKRSDASGMIRAAQDNKGTRGLVWIVSDAWDSTVTDLRNINLFVVKILQPEISKDFVDYFKSLSPYRQPWENDVNLRQFWRYVFHCSLPNDKQGSASRDCSGQESLNNTKYPWITAHTVLNAVNAFAYTIDAHQRESCPDTTEICDNMTFYDGHHMLNHLKSNTFKDYQGLPLNFTEGGEVEAEYAIMTYNEANSDGYHRVGTWLAKREEKNQKSLMMDQTRITWYGVDNRPPISRCSDVCPAGSTKKPRAGYNYTCCWICHVCNELQIIMNNTCMDGPIGYIPGNNRTVWIKRDLVYLQWGDYTPILFMIISGLSITLTTLTFIVFVLFRKKRVMKASGLEVNYMILSGIMLCFTVPFFHIAKPTDAICYVRKSSVGIAFAIIYAALFMKLNRIYRIFENAKISVRRPALVRPKQHMLVTLGLISIHLLFIALWFLIEPLQAVEVYNKDTEKLLLQCNTHETHFLGSLSYVIVLKILCTVYAFKTRKFPKNYNESKYIGVTLYTTCVILTIFVAFFFNTSDKQTADLLISGTCIIWGLVTLLGLYMQRVYLVLFVNDISENGQANLSCTTTQQLQLVNFKRKGKVEDTVRVIIRKGYKKRSVSF